MNMLQSAMRVFKLRKELQLFSSGSESQRRIVQFISRPIML